MSFLNPLGLLGLISLPVIIGLHLHMDRTQRAVVSSLFLWAFLDAKSHGKKPRRILLSWLLVLDLLVAATISLAFARPEIKLPPILGQERQLVILIDNSTSMLAIDVSPSRYAAAKAEAVELIEAAERYSTVTVIAVGNQVELIGDTGEFSQQRLIDRLVAWTAGGSGTQIRSGLAFAEGLIRPDHHVEVHLFSDGAFQFEQLDEFDYPLVWHFFGEEWPNQAVIKLQLVGEPSGEVQLFAGLLNTSAEVSIHQLRLLVDGHEVRRAEVHLQPETVTPYSVTLSEDFAYLQLELSVSDPLAEDNSAGVGYWSAEPIRVALVTSEPDPIDRALLAIPDLKLSIIDPEVYSYLSDYHLTVFRNHLPETWPDGAILVFDPPQGGEELSVRGVRIIEPQLEVIPDPITNGLIFSGVRWQEASRLADWQSQFEPLIVSGDIPLLLQSNRPEENVIVFLPQLSTGNLTRHPVFPLLISNVVESTRGFQPNQSYLIGEEIHFPQSFIDRGISIVDPAGLPVVIASSGTAQLNQFGMHTLMIGSDQNHSKMVSIGVNGGDSVESDLRPREWTESISETRSESVRERKISVDLTPWLLAGVCVLLVLEAWRAWR
jgi:hypothetical protein